MNTALDQLSSLANERRLAVFRYLVTLGSGGAPAGDIAVYMNVPANTLSAQLSQLSRAGLITGRREGRSIIYSVNFDAIGGLILFLLEDCCNGRSEVQTRILAAITDVCRDDKDCLDMADAVQMKKVQDE